jgi:hypothetical protein
VNALSKVPGLADELCYRRRRGTIPDKRGHRARGRRAYGNRGRADGRSVRRLRPCEFQRDYDNRVSNVNHGIDDGPEPSGRTDCRGDEQDLRGHRA